MKEVFEIEKWSNIDHELYRTYVFPNMEVTISSPKILYVSKSGGHRIVDAFDVAHYIPSGWVHLYWETDDNIIFRF